MEPDAAFHLVSLMPGDELRQGGALSDGKVVNLLLRSETQATWLKCVHQHAVARMHMRIMMCSTVYLERGVDHRRLGGRGGALEACGKLGRCGRAQLEGCRRGFGSDWRLRRCGRVRDGVDRGRGGHNAAGGPTVERCRRFGRRLRCRCHLRRRLRHFGRHRDLGGQLKRLRAKRLSRGLGLGLIVLDVEGAVGLDRVDRAGAPLEDEALGARVGARVSKR